MAQSKKLFTEAIAFFKQEKFKDAIDLLDILLLKDSKNIEYNMTMGLCHQKLKEFGKAEQLYLYSLEKRPDDLKILNALFKLYKDDLKCYEKAIPLVQKLIALQKKTDKIKAVDVQVEYCKILHANQERRLLDEQFKDILLNGNANHVQKVAEFYIPLLIDLKLLDVSQPEKCWQLFELSQKLSNQPVQFNIIEELMRKILQTIRSGYQDIIYGFAVSQEYYAILIQLMLLFPQSCYLLDEVLKYVHCFLNIQLKFILEQCILLLVHNEYSDLECHSNVILFQNYTDIDQYNRTNLKAKAFISFIRYFASEFLMSQGLQYQQAIDALIQSKQIDLIEKEKDFLFLEIPLKVASLYKSGQVDQQTQANILLVDFNKKMKQLKRQEFDCNLLEEISANLGYEILADPMELMEMKNLLKVRIKNKAYSLDTYEKYFDYQVKLVKLIRHYDEELPMQLIFDKILQDNPKNVKILIHQIWLQFSEKKIDQITLIEEYSKIQADNTQLQALIYKRLGTLRFIDKDIVVAREYFEKAANLQPDDHEIHLSIALVEYLMNNYTDCLERLYRAFNLCQNNYHLNQMIMFLLTKLGLKDKALEFAINIYKLPTFQNIYWLTFTIGQNLMMRAQFNSAHEMLQKAADQYHFNLDKTYKLYFEKKLDFQQFSIPYFINQNDNLFLSDFPIFSGQFYEENNMLILSERYFRDDKYLKLFKLEMKLAELKKILGLQGSALKSIQKAEQLLITTKSNHKIEELDQYLCQKSNPTGLKGQLIDFVCKFNQIQIKSKWISTLNIKQLDRQYSKLLILLNFEAAQLHLYGQNEYFAQERMIQAILMCIDSLYENENDQEVLILVRSYLPLVFEIGIQLIIQQKDHFNKQSAINLANQYLELFSIINNIIQLNTYTLECLREFFYHLGILLDSKYLLQSIKYSKNIIKQLCSIESEDINELFQQMRSILYGQDKKMLIIKNTFQSLLLSMFHLKMDCRNYLTLAISLFPTTDTFYLIGAKIYEKQQLSYIVKALETNPKSQEALYLLGYHYLKQQNYTFAFQAFQKSIECEPTTSAMSYLGIAIICLIYLQSNTLLQLSDVNKLRQFEALSLIQKQLHNQIGSYLNYVATLKNLPLLNILSIIYRNLYMGDSVISEAIIEELNIQNIPKEIRILFNCELQYAENPQLEEQFISLIDYATLEQELQKIMKSMATLETSIKWAQKLRYFLHLCTLMITKINSQEMLIDLMKNVFKFLIENITYIKYATYTYNFNDLYMHLIEKWYHYTRTNYLKNSKDQELKIYYLYVCNFKQSCQLLFNESETQLISYIDILQDKKYLLTNEINHKIKFMELIHNNDCSNALLYLQLAIMENPTNYTYRNVLNKIKNTNHTFSNTTVKQSLLEMNKSNQALNWLNIITNELINLRNISEPNERVKLIIQIIKFKILPYADNQMKHNLMQILCDCLIYDQNANQIISLIHLPEYEQKCRLRSKIQEKLEWPLIEQYKLTYIDHLEDFQNSKKSAQFMLPIIMQLQSHKNTELLNQTLLIYTQYAEQFLPKDQKLKTLKFIYNSLNYSEQLKKINDQDNIGTTLIKLKEISDEFLIQGIYNKQSLSLFIHYAIVTEKTQELQDWLDLTYHYLGQYDSIQQWGTVMEAYYNVVERKTIESLKQLLKVIEKSKFQIPALQSLSTFLIGQAMMNITDWQLKYLKEDILKKFQLANLLYPSIQISNHLAPLQGARIPKKQKNQRLKVDALLREEFQSKKQKKPLQDIGLNSDSDEMIVDQMDYEADLHEFNRDHLHMEHQENQFVQELVDPQMLVYQPIFYPEEFIDMSNQDQYYYLQEQGYTHEEIIIHLQNYHTMQFQQSIIQDEQIDPEQQQQQQQQ